MLIANSLAAQNKHVLFASGEGNRDDVFLVAGRLGITSDKIEVMGNAFDADEIIARCEEIEPFLLIVDSLQTTTLDDVEGSESSTSQGIAVANRITAFCKRTKMCSIIINHLSRSGDFAGSMTVEHLVDVVMLLCKDYKAEGADEDEPETVRERFLIVDKNRVGPEGAKSLWVMTAEGQFLEREKVSPLDPSKKKKGKITPLHSI
jgi:DNA repair protein RadA/Sms